MVKKKDMDALDAMKATWGDKSISLVGLHTIVVLVLVVALTWMGYLLHRSVSGTTEGINLAIDGLTKELTNQHTAMNEEVRKSFGRMEMTQNKVADAMDAQTFLMTKTDKERQMYKLDMPDGLRKRIR
jgi:hypothetical protein